MCIGVWHGVCFGVFRLQFLSNSLGFSASKIKMSNYISTRRETMIIRKLFTVFIAVLLLAACSKTVMEHEPVAEQEPEPVAQVEPPPQEPDPQAAIAGPDGRDEFVNEFVYFDFDSDALDPEAQSLLQIKAQWLTDNPDVLAVMIEGHCDERGTEAYNMALGARRADAVKKYLMDMGLNDLTIQTQSYGEERPVDAGHAEESWARNRRACFVIH
jgi:peptidoglycan-associated lipoprotein